MALPRDEPVLCGRADGESERRVGVAVAVAVVVVPAAVARGPHEDAAPAFAARRDALHERARRQPPGSVHRLTVVVGTPAKNTKLLRHSLVSKLRDWAKNLSSYISLPTGRIKEGGSIVSK